MFLRTMATIVSCILAGGVATAENRMQVHQADMSVPFGVASGYVMTVSDDFVFVNTEKPDASVHIPRANLASASVQDGVIFIVTREPIQGLKEFRFKLSDKSTDFSWTTSSAPASPDSNAQPKASPYRPVAASSTAASNQPNDAVQNVRYMARHDHFPRGSCEGHLIIEGNQITFESVTKIDHSRHWEASDIKQVKRDGPYKLSLRPFRGGELELKLMERGMSSRDYEMLTSRVADSRHGRQ